VMDFLF